MKQEPTKPKVSTRALYIWSLALMVVSFGMLMLIKYWTATTFCSIGDGCETVDTVGSIGRPIGALMFLAGLVLLIGATIRYIVLHRKKD